LATIGLCAMDKKIRGAPMQSILTRLRSYNEFEFISFGDDLLLQSPIEEWPRCDFLLAFHSTGFPLFKAMDYVRRYRPYCVNDLCMQSILLDRRLVLALLDASNVPTPPRIILSRDGGPTIRPDVQEHLTHHLGLTLPLPLHHSNHPKPLEIQEDEDKICINGTYSMPKPFVEKPILGEDHNLNIHYSSHQGGGTRRLFRKVGNRSSEFISGPSKIRREGSYIYERFFAVDNAQDVKVYTIGVDYAYAETRVSPCVDGIVRRNASGKEMRQVTALTEEEKEMARRVARTFGQTICGFDLLRVQGRSYVIDVNGWSFVKGNDAYYDRCSRILRRMFKAAMIKRRYSLSLPDGSGLDNL
ncbi:hypothetical protein BJ684DRAFT_8908, partial [Piptocephalis cylindrospora]